MTEPVTQTRAPRLVLITPDEPESTRLASLLEPIAAQVDAVVLRWPAASAREQFEHASVLAAVHPRPFLLLRGRVDVALAAELDGVQLHEGAVDPQRLRSRFPEWICGVSRHDESGLRERSVGADFALLSPFATTPSKPGQRAMGRDRFADCVKSSPVPILALGGIHSGNVEEALQLGAHGVAVRSAVFEAEDAVLECSRLREAIRARLECEGS